MRLDCPACIKEANFTFITECRCHEDQGAGYTYQDEYGDCEVHSYTHPAICSGCNGCFELEHLLRLKNRISCDELGYPAGEALFMDVEDWEKEYNTVWLEYINTVLQETIL